MEDKDFSLQNCKSQLKESQHEMSQLKSRHDKKIDSIERDTQRKFDELKQLYKSQVKSEGGRKDFEALNHAEQYVHKISQLEGNLLEISQNLEFKERNIKELTDQVAKLQDKVKSKKEKNRGILQEYSDKNRECEKFRLEAETLKEKLARAEENTNFN